MSLCAEGLQHAFNHPVLDGVTMDIRPKDFCCLLGPNGSGKSTLLRALAGLIRPDAGTVSLNKSPVSSLSASQRAQSIGFLPQEIHPAFSFSVFDSVALGAKLAGHGNWFASKPNQALIEAVQAALTTVEAEHLMYRKLHELSGGERRRVLIAGVLAQEPDYLLLDEPGAMLDLHYHSSLFALLQRLADSGMGVLCVTHDWNVASNFASSLHVLHEGRTLAQGTAKDVMNHMTLETLFDNEYELLARDNRPPVLLPR